MTLQNFKTYVCELAFLWQHFSLPHKESVEKASKMLRWYRKSSAASTCSASLCMRMEKDNK